jgi:hypothetical protein
MSALPHHKSVAKAKTCQAKAVAIPSHPMVEMARVALLNSKSDFDLLQNAIDYLTCKAKAKLAFLDDEKTFLIDLYKDMSLGGSLKGYSDAAKLLSHYIDGNGEDLEIDSDVYSTSTIVKDTSEAIKKYIKKHKSKNKQLTTVQTSDHDFIYAAEAKTLLRTAHRNIKKQGYLQHDGYLLAEQDNLELKNANNRFILVALNAFKPKNNIATRWSVDDDYVFESFEKSSKYTEIPLSETLKLKLPDGLSHYMTVLKIAAEFHYWAAWQEIWNA